MKRAAKTTKSGPPKHASRQAAQAVPYFSVLTGCAPDGARITLWAGAEPAKFKLGLVVIQRVDDPAALVGWARAPQFASLVCPAALPVNCPVRGGAAGAKLLVLGGDGSGGGPSRRVHDAGMTKALVRIRAELLLAGWDPALAWWGAYRFAGAGYIAKLQLKEAALALGVRPPRQISGLAAEGSLLAWPDQVDQLADQLKDLLTAPKPCNRFVSEMETSHVQRWLKLTEPGLAKLVLRVLASENKLRWTIGLSSSAILLAGDVKPQPASAADQQLAQALLDRFERGAGIKRSLLEAEHPAQLHVINGLFDAELLLEGPDGFVFTRQQLKQWLKQLKAQGVKDLPGVKQIKDGLGLPRRTAEALRALLVARRGGTPDVEEPPESRKSHV